MEESPEPSGGQQLMRIQAYVVILAVIAVILFGSCWFVLGELGIDSAPRLLASFCLPPGIIALILGIFLVIRRNNHA